MIWSFNKTSIERSSVGTSGCSGGQLGRGVGFDVGVFKVTVLFAGSCSLAMRLWWHDNCEAIKFQPQSGLA